MSILDVVDGRDRVIGRASFEECHAKGLPHRGVTVFVFRDSSLREVLLHVRARGLNEPGKLLGSACGHVEAGQDYEEAALRELAEELFCGRKAPELSLALLGKARTSDRPGNTEFISLYSTVYPGPFFPDPNEVEQPHFVAVAELRKDVKAHPEKYCVSFLQYFTFLEKAVRTRARSSPCGARRRSSSSRASRGPP